MTSRKIFTLVTALSSLIFGTVAATATVASVSSSDATTSPITLAQASPSKIVVEKDKVRFQLDSCRRTGLQVTCSLLITNLAEDTDITLYATYLSSRSSRTVDFSGNQYFAQTVSIGGSEKATRYVETKLFQGIPLKATVSFKLPQKVKQLAIIEIFFRANSNYNTAQFRNVKVN